MINIESFGQFPSLISRLNRVKTVKDLQNIGIGKLINHIDSDAEGGAPGNMLGFPCDDVAEAVGVDPQYLPKYFGANCSYLGGQISGKVYPSSFNPRVPDEQKNVLKALGMACVRAYKNGRP